MRSPILSGLGPPPCGLRRFIPCGLGLFWRLFETRRGPKACPRLREGEARGIPQRRRALRGFYLFLALACFSTTAQAQEWKTVKGEHFIVFHDSNESFARKVINRAEQYYRGIAHDLGYTRSTKFWSWENRVKIYIYPSKESYIAATGAPEWTDGLANYRNRLIASFAGSHDFTENVLPHEIAHLIFRDFVGFVGDIPLWLDEGIAQWWTSGTKDRVIQGRAKELYERNAILSIEDITDFDIRQVQNLPYVKKVRTKNGSAAILILTPDQLIGTFYLQSASLVGFMRERYGPYRFTRFCRELRDNKSLPQALTAAYGEYFKDTRGLEKAWRQYLAS